MTSTSIEDLIADGSRDDIDALIHSRTPSTSETRNAGDESPLLIRVNEVCRLTGLSRASVYRRADAYDMPRPCKVGRRTLWRRADIDAWVTGGCRPIRPDNKDSKPAEASS